MDNSKRDWKLFQEKIGDWQERYMEKLLYGYVRLLASDKMPSDKFHELENRIKKDGKKPGVRIMLDKENMISDLCRLLKDEVITMEDLENFGDETKDMIKRIREV